jgi:hypothetical protein
LFVVLVVFAFLPKIPGNILPAAPKTAGIAIPNAMPTPKVPPFCFTTIVFTLHQSLEN